LRDFEIDHRAGAVLINELDTGGFQSAADREVVCCSHGCRVNCQLGTADQGKAIGRLLL